MESDAKLRGFALLLSSTYRCSAISFERRFGGATGSSSEWYESLFVRKSRLFSDSGSGVSGSGVSGSGVSGSGVSGSPFAATFTGKPFLAVSSKRLSPFERLRGELWAQ